MQGLVEIQEWQSCGKTMKLYGDLEDHYTVIIEKDVLEALEQEMRGMEQILQLFDTSLFKTSWFRYDFEGVELELERYFKERDTLDWLIPGLKVQVDRFRDLMKRF